MKMVEKLLFLAKGDKNTQKLEKEDLYINELIDETVKETYTFQRDKKVYKQ